MTRSFRAILLLSLLARRCDGLHHAPPSSRRKRNEERCVERGYQARTDAFSDCVVRLDDERNARMDARHREQIEKSAEPSSNRGY